MKVLLDLGNTRLKAGLLRLTAQGPELATTFATTYDQGQGLSQWLERHLQAEPCPQVQALGISVVTTETRRHVEGILSHHQCHVHWLDACTPNPMVHNAYEEYTQLGADRWFGALGAWYQLNPHPAQALINCSFGTATTIDTMIPRAAFPATHRPATQKPWVYLGGLILPGPSLMYQSLDQHTARLGLGQGDLQDFPTNTRSAISSGIANAQIGALTQQILKTQRLCPHHPVLIVCSGGGWPLVANALDQLVEQWPTLHTGPQPELHHTEHPVLLGLGNTSVPTKQSANRP